MRSEGNAFSLCLNLCRASQPVCIRAYNTFAVVVCFCICHSNKSSGYGSVFFAKSTTGKRKVS